MDRTSIDSALQPRAFPDLPPAQVIEQAFGAGHVVRRQRLLVLPVLANPLCEHHLVVYTSDLPDSRLRLVTFSKRESLDPQVPSRDWSELCSADMPAARLEQFVDLLADRLDGAPLELRDVDVLRRESDFTGGRSGRVTEGEPTPPHREPAS